MCDDDEEKDALEIQYTCRGSGPITVITFFESVPFYKAEHMQST